MIPHSHTVLRLGCDLCPICFMHLERNRMIPVMYRLPGFDGFEMASCGEIVLGGCTVGWMGAVCPRCHFPVLLSEWVDDPDRVSVDLISLPGLTPAESSKMQRFITETMGNYHQELGDCVLPALVTEDDVWVGTREQGLHQYNRSTGEWRSFEDGLVGYCIKNIWRKGCRICVEDDTIGTHAFFYIECTEDRGMTWVRP